MVPRRARSLADIRIELLTSDEEFWALAPEWNALLAASSTKSVFMTWEWISTWWKVFGRGYSLRIYLARQPETGTLLGLLPFALREYTVIDHTIYRELTIMGSEGAAPDHLDCVLRKGHEQSVMRAFTRHVWSEQLDWDSIKLVSMASKAYASESFTSQMNHRYYHIHHVVSPYIRLPASWDNYRRTLSKNMRYNIGRYERKLEKEAPGQVVYRRVRQEEDLPDAMNLLFRLHSEVRQAKGGSYIGDAQPLEFHKTVARRLLSKGWLRLYLLTVSGNDIAALFCINCDNVVSFYTTGYSLDWSSYSPGRLLIAYAIRQSIEEGAYEFDFLRGNEKYKFNWTDDYRLDFYFRIPRSMLGNLAIRGYSLARSFKRLYIRNDRTN
jgi:CelD/BcsL family acetyltransferase involved in cellulose biosynthesis